SAPAHETRGTSASCRRSDRAQIFTISLEVMRFGAHGARSQSTAKAAKDAKKNFVLVLCVLCGLCGSMSCRASSLFKQYEYEEDMYLSLDGSATLYVNSSIAALNALRGTRFDAAPSTPVDRDAVRAYFNSPSTRVARVTT